VKDDIIERVLRELCFHWEGGAPPSERDAKDAHAALGHDRTATKIVVLRELAAELHRDSDRHIDEDCDDCYADAARGGNSAREELAEEYTRRAGELSKLDKTYEVTMKLGAASSTGDPEGEIAPVEGPIPDKKALQEALKRFTGQIDQVPPAYSAIKIDGQRAYKLARAGKEVKIESRQVTINGLELIDYAYPEVKFTANVSSGTYIRALVEDLGKALGTGAYTTGLRRTAVGDYGLDGAVSPKDISTSNIPEGLKTL
jgi:tRNA pseudouridine55 synthase